MQSPQGVAAMLKTCGGRLDSSLVHFRCSCDGVAQGSHLGLKIDVSISGSVEDREYTSGRLKEYRGSVLDTLGCSEAV